MVTRFKGLPRQKGGCFLRFKSYGLSFLTSKKCWNQWAEQGQPSALRTPHASERIQDSPNGFFVDSALLKNSYRKTSILQKAALKDQQDSKIDKGSRKSPAA